MNYFNQDAENVLRELGSDRKKVLQPRRLMKAVLKTVKTLLPRKNQKVF